MPSLPKKNTLDYNPNSIINASKKLSVISLENMKNPVLDPDQATLSTLDATKKLDDSINSLDYVAGLFHSGIIKVQNLLAPVVSGRGRKLQGGGPKKKQPVILDIVDDDSDDEVKGYNKRLETIKNQKNRFTNKFSEIGNQNPQAISSSSGLDLSQFSSKMPPNSPIDSDDEASVKKSVNNSHIYEQSGDFDSDNGIVNIEYDNKSWVASILYLIQLLRKMDMIMVSKIKPALNSLTQPQISKIGDIYELVNTSYDNITNPFRRRGEELDPYTKVKRNVDIKKTYGMTYTEAYVIKQNEYGDEIINTFNNERKKLLLDITVVVNSWKQNSPNGSQTEFGEKITKDYETTANINRQLYNSDNMLDGSGRQHSIRMGCGRNFFGEKINNSRDIPCLLSSIKNCPTKYLL